MTRWHGRDQGSSGPNRHARVSLDGARAQTTIDFMIGAGVFLLVVAFVLGIIPSLIDPFSDSQETTLVADRLATQVGEGMLADPDRPTVLNQTCVNAFFGHGTADGEGCPVPFDESITDLPNRLGVQDRHQINITVRRNVDTDPRLEILHTDGVSVGPSGPTRLAIGPDEPGSQSVVVASRTAFLDEKDVTVVVKVW